jgi:putative ABC transport system permease protein
MRIPVTHGRPLEASDRAGAAGVAVVNKELVRRYLPGTSAANVLGRRVRVGNADSDEEWLTIVGVVGDVKHWNLAEPASPQLYRALAQAPATQFSFVLQVSGDAATAERATRQALLALDRDQPVTIGAMAGLVRATMVQPRFRSLLLGTFAVIALLLAVIGIYGVISHGVAQRTREIGVRLALGAQRRDIVRLVLREGMLLTAAGLAAGVVAALAFTRLLRGMLFGVTTHDLGTFVAVSLLLTVTAALANFLPARRASRVDPMVTMQAE